MNAADGKWAVVCSRWEMDDARSRQMMGCPERHVGDALLRAAGGRWALV